jgi:superoxide reductase
MTKINELYRCEVCGNIVGVFHGASGNLVCCGRQMENIPEKSVDEGKEKHVPVIEKTETGIRVKVGALPHPMDDDHYIEWIEVSPGDSVLIHGLRRGEKPEFEFPVHKADVKVRAYCNKHGLWTNRPK